MSALVSVIVPVFNVEKYLKQCLDSLINQTYKNIEVIMVDDGSTDTSGEICDDYEKKYVNFKVVHKENAGLGMARNTGLEFANGEFVTFLDSDDYLESDCIEVLYTSLLNQNVDMCKGGFKRTLDSGEIILDRKYDNEIYAGNSAKLELLPRMIGSSPTGHDSIEMCVCGALYRSSLIKQNNLKFPSERELISEDLVFNLEYMQYANGACTIERTGYNYRINLQSLTTSYRADRFEACRHFYLVMKEKLLTLGYNENVLLRLDKMLFIYLRMCFKQLNTDICGLTNQESIHKIKEICNDNVVRDSINSYPIRMLGFKQALFIYLIKAKLARTIHFIFEKNIIN